MSGRRCYNPRGNREPVPAQEAPGIREHSSQIGTTMTVFGIGTMELILILLLLILVFGPDRISEMARWLGQAYRKLSGVTSEVNRQVTQVRKAVDGSLEMPNLARPLQEAAAEIDAVQKGVSQEISAPPEAAPVAAAGEEEE